MSPAGLVEGVEEEMWRSGAGSQWQTHLTKIPGSSLHLHCPLAATRGRSHFPREGTGGKGRWALPGGVWGPTRPVAVLATPLCSPWELGGGHLWPVSSTEKGRGHTAGTSALPGGKAPGTLPSVQGQLPASHPTRPMPHGTQVASSWQKPNPTPLLGPRPPPRLPRELPAQEGLRKRTGCQ